MKIAYNINGPLEVIVNGYYVCKKIYLAAVGEELVQSLL